MLRCAERPNTPWELGDWNLSGEGEKNGAFSKPERENDCGSVSSPDVTFRRKPENFRFCGGFDRALRG